MLNEMGHTMHAYCVAYLLEKLEGNDGAVP